MIIFLASINISDVVPPLDLAISAAICCPPIPSVLPDQKNAVFGSVLTLLFSHHLSKPKGSSQSCPLSANQ